MTTLENKNTFNSTTLFRFGILLYWSLFWLINSLDKMIGGSKFLWVGKDRFAQFQRFFASASWENPIITNIALIFVSALEIFAFLFFTGALIHLYKRNEDSSRSLFIVGISFTLATFSIFAIGDHIFGDRLELLEHTLFWFITLFSWVAFVHSDKFLNVHNYVLPKNQMTASLLSITVIAMVTHFSIIKHKNEAFHERKDGINYALKGDDFYKFSFPFLAGSTSFENTLIDFKQNNPKKRIIEIYTLPNELRKQKADGLIIYILAEDKK